MVNQFIHFNVHINSFAVITFYYKYFAKTLTGFELSLSPYTVLDVEEVLFTYK